MKLIVAIVQDEDAARLIGRLMQDGFSVTKLATTGGFLRSGNTTLLAGVEDDRLTAALDIINSTCKNRKQMSPVQASISGTAGVFMPAVPVEVTIGGATVFVMDVEQFLKF